MRIAQVAPLYESVPPQLYGGTERIVSYLTEELVALGHDVTLFASGDSETAAQLIPMAKMGLRLDKKVIDPFATHYFMLEQVAKVALEFDMIHFHVDYLHFSLSRREDYQHVTTLHGRLDIPEVIRLHEEFPTMPLISISESQRQPMGQKNWVGTVHHGIPKNLYNLNPSPQPYLAFLGRVSPEKRLDRAIQIAELSGMPLKVAAKIDAADRDYFESTLEPVLKHTASVEFLGEVNDDQKQQFLGNATALLFPIDWPEPFGLVMLEAMACGTPVIAYENGSVPEIIEPGVTGYIVSSVMEAVRAVKNLASFNRATCRNEFERRFTSKRMAQDYLDIYQSVMSEKSYRTSVKQLPVVAM